MPPSSNKENFGLKQHINIHRSTEFKASLLSNQPENVLSQILKPKIDAGNEKVENSLLEFKDKDKRESG
jgi:hypothetical protein